VGSIEQPGGVMRQLEAPLAPWPQLEEDAVAARGLFRARADGASGNGLAGDVAHGLTRAPHPIEVLFLYHANPVYEDPPGLGWEQLLERIPLVVSFSPYLDETSEHADLLLPDCTFLEKWFLEPLEPSLGYPAVGLGRPVVEPLYDTRNIGDTLIALARAAGEPLAAAMPWAGFLEALQDRARGLYEAGYGMPSGERQETFGAFWSRFEAQGVWYAEPYSFGEWGRVLPTTSSRFQFASTELVQMLPGLGEPLEDEAPLPHYVEAVFEGDETEYPFHLRTFKLVTYTERWPPNMPWLQETYGLHLQEKWDSWVELNPETARELGIQDGDLVRVASTQGQFELRARLWAGTPADVVSIPVGQGHTAGGRWAENRGANPVALIAPLTDQITGELAMQSTRVRVVKA